jgi:hypothetical protein
VAQELLEQWAIDDRVAGEDDETINKYQQYAIDDTVFIINTYMEKFNEIMSRKSLSTD